MTKAWWLGFPRLKCPHCGKVIEGIRFAGRFKLPRVRRESGAHSGLASASSGLRTDVPVPAAANPLPRLKKGLTVVDPAGNVVDHEDAVVEK